MFLLNSGLDRERETVLDWDDPTPTRVLAAQTLTQLKAINTFDALNRVRPEEQDAPRPGASMTLGLPKASYTVVHLSTA